MKKYKSEIYSKYISSHNEHLYGAMTIDKIIQSFGLWDHYYLKDLPENKNIKILDIGCGEGGFVYYLRTKGYEACTGVDVSEEQIMKGVKLGIEGLIKEDIFKFLETTIKSYDFIVARDVLEHFKKEEIYSIVELIFKSLRKGGKLLFQSPNGDGIQVEKIYEGDFTHETKFTIDSSNQLLRSVGFTDILCQPILFPVRSLRSWLRMLGWKWIVWNHQIKRKIIYGSEYGIFTPNIMVIASKPSE